MKILHGYADTGIESELLTEHGDVYRVGLDPTDSNDSKRVKADMRNPPFSDGSFDLAVVHPPCGFVSPMSDTGDGDRRDWPNLIPDARREAKRLADHYIIENKAEAAEYMNDPVVLEGEMFAKPYEYKRAFETSFSVSTPPKIETFDRTEMQPFFYTEHSRERWAAAKGYPADYSKEHLAKNSVPRIYLEYLLTHYYDYVDSEARPDYTEYDKEMDARRAQSENEQLTKYATDHQ